jgi:hypothetical protein
VKSLCGSSSLGCWVGGHHYNTSTGNGWKWSDDSSVWNETVFLGEPLHACSDAACKVATGSDLCTLVTNNGRVSIIMEKRCSEAHGLICMMNHGESVIY